MTKLGTPLGTSLGSTSIGSDLGVGLPGFPWYLPHRGEAGVEPENSRSGLARSSRESPFVDMDAHVISDGTAVVMHDDTIDRTSSGTGAVASFTRATWQAQVLDSSAWMGGVGYANEPLPLLSDVLRDIQRGREPTISVEAKNVGSGAAITAALLEARVPRNRAIVAQFGVTELAAPVAAGYQAMYLIPALSSVGSWATLIGLGIRYVCFTTIEAGTAAAITAAKAAGLRVLSYTQDRKVDAASYLALGVDGIYSNHSRYVGSSGPFADRDTWADGKWMSGMLPDSGNRGLVMSGGRWGYADTTQSWAGCLMGWLCPLPASYTVKFNVNVAAWANTGRWWAIFLGAGNDSEYVNGAISALSGYTLLVRQSGSFEIYKKDPGTSGVSLSANFSGAPFVAGVDEAFTLTVTPTNVSLTRDSNGNALSYADATYRGGFLHFGRNGCSPGFSSMRRA